MPNSSLSATPTRLAAALAVAIGMGLAAPAQAETFALGVISSPQALSIGNDGLSGWFNDVYTFTVEEGSSFDFSGIVSSLFSASLPGVANLSSQLLSGDPSFVQSAVGSTLPLGGGLSLRTATYAPTVLEAGTYGLFVTGLASAGSSFTSAYSGQIRFGGIAAPVPEPGAMALMALGLVGVGAAARRKLKR